MDDYERLRERHKEMKAQNAQLRKRLRLVEEELERIKAIIEAADSVVAETLPPSPIYMDNALPVCTKCGDKLLVLSKGKALLHICTGCGKRHTKKVE